MWTNFIYFFKRKYRQIQRVIDFLPIIWKGFDFDYQYSIELFKKQLERTADFLESDRAYSMDAKQRASRIRTAIRLMGKVYDEDYSMEWIHQIYKKYGEDVLDWESEDTGRGDGTSYLKYKYEKWSNTKEITEIKIKLLKESRAKQERAHKLLWKFIEHNIRHWWD